MMLEKSIVKEGLFWLTVQGYSHHGRKVITAGYDAAIHIASTTGTHIRMNSWSSSSLLYIQS